MSAIEMTPSTAGIGVIERGQVGKILGESIVRNVQEFKEVTGKGEKDESPGLKEAAEATVEGGLFFPTAIAYRCDKEIVMGNGSTWFGGSRWHSIMRTASKTEYILKIKEGQCNIIHMRFEAINEQTAGGAVDMSTGIDNNTMEDISFGSNFFIGVNASGIAGGGTMLSDMTWQESGTDVVGTGTCIKIGDGVNLVVKVDLFNVNIVGKSLVGKEGVSQGVVYNYTDSCTITSSLFQTCKKAITTGNVVGSNKQNTGLKIVDTIVDTCEAACYDFALVRDCAMTGCNGQGGFQGILLRGEKEAGWEPTTGVRCINCTFQRNVGEGFLAELGTTHWKLQDSAVSSNCTGGAATAGIHVIQGSKKWSVTGTYSGNDTTLPGGKQKIGLLVEAGVETNEYTITDNEFPLDAEQTVGLEDNGTGKIKKVFGNREGAVEYSAKTERETGKPFTASKSSTTFLSLAVQVKAATAAKVELLIDGKYAGEAAVGVDASGITTIQLVGIVPCNKTWELVVVSGAVEKLFSTYAPM